MPLFNPFALLTAITALGLLAMHGAVYLQLRTEDEIAERAKEKVFTAAIVTLIGFILTGLWVMRLEGYHVTSEILHGGVSNPLAKFVKRGEELWSDNYEHIPALIAIPVCEGQIYSHFPQPTHFDSSITGILFSSMESALNSFGQLLAQ